LHKINLGIELFSFDGYNICAIKKDVAE